MASQVIPVTGLSDVGLIADMPPVTIPPNGFSDCRNVRFRNGNAQKMKGDIEVFPYLELGTEDVIKYVAWWPNPNLSIFNQGYYLLIIQQGDNDEAYLIKVGETGTAEEPLELTTSATNHKGTFEPGGNWQHTFFQGGFALIINNGLETPQYILDGEENVEVNGVPDFAVLPNWESYASDLESDDDDISSLSNLKVTAGVIRSFGDFLIAGNLVERGDFTRDGEDITNGIVRSLPSVIRTSDIAGPGGIPQNWNPFADGVNTADEFVITTDGIVQDFVELQGKMYVYSNSSISVISRTGSPAVPFSVQPVTPVYGAMTTDSVIEFDGRHFVVGAQDIYIFGGHPGSIQSVGEDKVRRYFYDNLSVIDIEQVFVLRYQQEDEIWVCYPSQTAVGGRADEALIWNYRNQTWTKRDLNGVFNGVIGPIPGGGLPEAEIEFDGTVQPSTVIPGKVHEIKISGLADIAMSGDGEQYSETLDLSAIPIAESSGDPTIRIIFNPDFWTGGAADAPPLRFIARVKDQEGNTLMNINDCLPEGLGEDPNSTDNVDYNTFDYYSTVVQPIVGFLNDQQPALDGEITILPVSDAANLANVAIDIVFNKEIIGEDNPILTLSIAKEISITEEDDLAAKDRPTEDGEPDTTIDRLGHITFDESQPPDTLITNPIIDSNVFTYNFEDIWDDLDNYVFFFKGERIGFVNGNNNFDDLPANSTIYSGVLKAGETESEIEGNDHVSQVQVIWTAAEATTSFTINRDAQFNTQDESDKEDLYDDDAGNLPGIDSDLDGITLEDGTVSNIIVTVTPFGGGESTTYDLSDGDFTVSGSDNKTITLNTPTPAESSVIVLIYYVQHADELDIDDDSDEIADGHMRVTTDFGQFSASSGLPIASNDIAMTVADPLTGSDIKTLIARGEFEGSHRLDFLLVNKVDVGSTPDAGHLNLIAYKIPDVSDGIADYKYDTIGTAILNLQFYNAVFNKDTNSWEKDEPLAPLTALLSYSADPSVQDDQNEAYAKGIIEAIKTTADFTSALGTGDDGAQKVTITSVANAPYILEYELEDLIESKADPEDDDVPIPTSTITSTLIKRGLYKFDNTGKERPIVAPCIRLQHVDPDGIEFFSFDTGTFELRRPYGNDDLTVAEQQDLIDDAIQLAAPGQWRRNGDTWSTRAVRYNEFKGDTGVPYPNEDRTYDFPAERNGNNWDIVSFVEGITDADKPTFAIETQGNYETVTPGSYFTMALSNGVNYLFPVTGDDAAAELRPDILTRIPELQVELTSSGNGLYIQPAVIGHNSIYYTEGFFNTTSTIDDFNRLLNASNYQQDEMNIELELSLPDAVLMPSMAEFPSIDGGPVVTSSSVTTDFDVDRTWSTTQVDFSYEFPIFAAGRTFANGNSVNGVLAAEIGYTFPEFTKDGIVATAYESFIERDQLALSPEFETEHLYGIALWADGSSRRVFQGEYQYNVLQLNLSTTDNPGQRVDLSNPQQSNTHYISEDYKMDTRLTGRFLNWNLTDNVSGTLQSPGGKTFSQETEWRVSGLQLKIKTAGRR